jgi:hypothetical protein
MLRQAQHEDTIHILTLSLSKGERFVVDGRVKPGHDM